VARETSTFLVVGLLGIAVTVLAAALIVAFVPMVECKECALLIRILDALEHEMQSVDVNGKPQIVMAPTPNPGPLPKPGCGNCVRGKRTLLKNWLLERKTGR